MREWVTNLKTTHYCVGSAIGPHPFPTIVRDFQRVIGREIKQQLHEKIGKLPDAVIACVGGGSNAIGTFYDFIEEKNVRLIGVEAGGDGELCELLLRRTRWLTAWTDPSQVLRLLDTRPPWLSESLESCTEYEPTCCSRLPVRSWRPIPFPLVWTTQCVAKLRE
jgi:hypothetical protein